MTLSINTCIGVNETNGAMQIARLAAVVFSTNAAGSLILIGGETSEPLGGTCPPKIYWCHAHVTCVSAPPYPCYTCTVFIQIKATPHIVAT